MEEIQRAKPADFTIAKSNWLNEASYQATLNQMRVLHLGISKINPLDKAETLKPIKITAQEFAKQFNLHEKTAYRDLKNATLGIYDLKIIRHKSPTRTEYMRWVKKATTESGDNWISFELSDDVTPHLTELKSRFTSYLIKHIANIKKTGSIRLYELCQQWNKTTGSFYVTVSDLRVMLGYEGKYKTWAEFNRRVIQPAITEINAKTDITIEMKKARKRGSLEIEKLWFIITPQEQLQIEGF